MNFGRSIEQFHRSVSLLILMSLAMFTPAVVADEGMWLMNKPPLELLKKRHGFEPDAKWLEHQQKSAVRFSSGGSGSIISADGLVMTNHHVGSDSIEALSTKERNLLRDGFYAPTHADELKCQDLELKALWEIADVTDRVQAAAPATMSIADANTARRKMCATIEGETKAKSGLDCEVVTLFHGARYHLYSYKRYTDVRLVMAPEESIAFFGGDNDNFEYPRFCLDVSFFRIYENDAPLKAQHHLRFSADGSKTGDLALVCGHPARTRRLYTTEHLQFMRDVEVPHVLRTLWRREVQLLCFYGRSAEHARVASGDLHGVQNSRKVYDGMLASLLDPTFLANRRRQEEALPAALEKDETLVKQMLAAKAQLATTLTKYREFYHRYSVLEGRQMALRGELYSAARTLVRLATELPKPSEERLREYRDSGLDTLYHGLYAETPIYDTLEVERLASGLSFLAETLGAGDPLVVKVLDGLAPRARAEALVRGTKLRDIAVRKQIAEGGAAALHGANDPLIELAAFLDPEARRLRKRYEDEIESVERDAYPRLAAAQLAAYGDRQYPDATFTLRLSFGPIAGYREAGADVPPYTTMGGAFARMEDRGGLDPFALPDSWRAAKSKLELDTPYNFVCTADIIGGNSGSPVVNRVGEVIGIIFDGNLQSLSADLAYDDKLARALSVDARAIIESLRKIYGASALADEILRK
ncbi:MAG: S46 family peptidase [Planctomycetota bacterium]